MLKLSWSQVAAWRSRRHHLDRRMPAGSMLQVANRLCGLHAQVLSSALLTLWARVEELDRGAVQRALWQDRSLVKTWAMRGTLHLLPASELPLWHTALSTSDRYRKPAIWRRFGLTLGELDRLTEAIGTALDGCVMTREELAHRVQELTGSAALAAKLAESSWGTILKPAAFSGKLCFGPSVGQRVRFTLPSSWLAVTQQRNGEAASATVARRFLAAYGPATYHDLARWWGGGGIAGARRWLDELGADVSPVDVGGVPAWMSTADVRKARDFEPVRSVRLLPAFDQYVIGASRHAERLLSDNRRSRVYRSQGWISPVLLVNGFMRGIWRHEFKGNRLEVTLAPFGTIPTGARRAAEEEAERLATFLDRKLNLVWRH
jgi:hypothetical protein